MTPAQAPWSTLNCLRRLVCTPRHGKTPGRVKQGKRLDAAALRAATCKTGDDSEAVHCYGPPPSGAASRGRGHVTPVPDRAGGSGMVGYLRSVWDCRYFWCSLVRMDIRSRYRGSLIGMGWSLVNPIFMSAILCAAFCAIFKQDPLEFGLYLFAGLTVWNFIRDATQQGCLSFFHAEGYIRQFPAPMAIYPLRTVLANAFHFLMALIPALVLSACRNGHVSVPALLLGVLPGAVLLLALGWSVAVLVGVANVHFRDTRHITDIAMQVFFYLTPVMYPKEFVQQRFLGRLMQTYNPVTPFLSLIRDSILNNQLPPASAYASAALIVMAMGSVAAVALWNEERRLIFHL